MGRKGRGGGEIEGGKENRAEKKRTRKSRGMEGRRGRSTEERRENEGKKGEERKGETIQIAGDFLFLLILSVFTSILLLSTRYRSIYDH